MSPEALRESVASIALICRKWDGHLWWLARWNRNWDCYNFVGGHKHDDETFRECVIREIGEELGLEEGRDFRVDADPVTHLDYVAWSEKSRSDTHYSMDLFPVELRGEEARKTLAGSANLSWLSRGEILAQECADGKPVSPTMTRLLNSLQWQCRVLTFEDGLQGGERSDNGQ